MGGSISVSYNYSSFIQTLNKPILFDLYKDTKSDYDYLVKKNITESNKYFYIDKTSVKIQYNVSTIILFFMIFRIYHFFRLVNTFSSWNNPTSTSVCKKMNCSADVSFGIRAILKQHPSLSLVFGMIFVVVFFGTQLSIFEYYNQAQMACMGVSQEELNFFYTQIMMSFSNIYNSFWLVIVTMTTSIKYFLLIINF